MRETSELRGFTAAGGAEATPQLCGAGARPPKSDRTRFACGARQLGGADGAPSTIRFPRTGYFISNVPIQSSSFSSSNASSPETSPTQSASSNDIFASARVQSFPAKIPYGPEGP